MQPGQFTDDTELALAIMLVISEHGSYDQNLVAEVYHKWYLSKPFDIGNTIRNALSQVSANNMILKSKIHNSMSMSNGFLMRLFGLVALYYDKTMDELMNAILEDVQLTHSHPASLIGISFLD